MSLVLITGGTGSFGTACTRTLLDAGDRVIVFSRDELKQSEMARAFAPEVAADRLRFFLGDVRDPARLHRAFEAQPDLVIHAAALKQVPACEQNPFEAMKTNVLGAMHVIDAAIDSDIPRVVALSTDKAVQPLNAYGKSKALAESLFVRGNAYVGTRRTRFVVVRYGNVINSRGSVVPIFEQQREAGELQVTDRGATRFWMPLSLAIETVRWAADQAPAGAIVVPKIPSALVLDVARAIAPACPVRVTGLRPGEKLHEILIAPEEAAQTVEDRRWGDGRVVSHYVILPTSPTWVVAPIDHARAVPPDFRYTSDLQPQPVTVREPVCA